MQTNSHAAFYAVALLGVLVALGLLATCIYLPVKSPPVKKPVHIESDHSFTEEVQIFGSEVKHSVPAGWKKVKTNPPPRLYPITDPVHVSSVILHRTYSSPWIWIEPKNQEGVHTCVPGVDPYPCGTWIKVNGEWRKM